MILSNKTFKHHVVNLVRATEPVPLRCMHAMECGGCAFQDRAYEAQLAVKAGALQQVWDGALPGVVAAPIELIASPDGFGYRTRMDYVTGKQRLGLRRRGKFNYIEDLRECHLIPPEDFALVRQVYDRAIALGLPDYNLRTHEGFMRYVVVRRSPEGQLLLALVANSRDFQVEMEQLAALALADERVVGLHWLLNDAITDVAFGLPVQHWGRERLPMRVGERVLEIGPNTFFQNNIHLLEHLLADVHAAAIPPGTRPVVADLYGGVGTIALHLAEHAAQVVSVEEWAESAALAQHNIALNRVGNVQAVAASCLDFLRQQSPGAFDVVVVDPPRIGLGLEVCRELLRLRPQTIVYVSCNPITQAQDAHTLLERFRLGSLRGYDMFPQTPHMEALAVFERG